VQFTFLFEIPLKISNPSFRSMARHDYHEDEDGGFTVIP